MIVRLLQRAARQVLPVRSSLLADRLRSLGRYRAARLVATVTSGPAFIHHQPSSRACSLISGGVPVTKPPE
jgi:hypothetical protein